MAKFAQYYLMYKGDAGSYDWDKRQEHLGEVFKEDSSIEFGLGEGNQRKVFKHRVYHLNANPNIIIMRFANDKDLPIEKDFEETVAKHEPSCFLIIDNREGMRSVAIQYRREAFSSTSQVSKIITENLTQVLYHDHCYSVVLYRITIPKTCSKHGQISSSILLLCGLVHQTKNRMR